MKTDTRRVSPAELRKLPTPFFVTDVAELGRQLADFREVFAGADIYYAAKANGHPGVLTALANAHCGFEAASWHEIELLLSLGVSAERIIYGTAVKPADHVERARAVGIHRYAADSIEELDMLARLAPSAQVFVRARVDDSHSAFQMSRKFGAAIDDVADLVLYGAAQGLAPWGLSINVGSQSSSASAWADGIALLGPVLHQLLAADIRLEVLNLGGGFPVAYSNQPNVPSLQVIAGHVDAAMDELPYRPDIIAEPGRALVAPSTQFIATVIARVERTDGSWLFLDGGTYNGLGEALSGQGATRYPVRRLDEHREVDDLRFVLTGPSADALDLIARDVALPVDTTSGHRLVFENAGAYTLALSSRFNGFPEPPLHVVTESHARLDTQHADPVAIDTVQSRIAIGFPESPRDWCAAPAEIGEHNLRVLGHPVMEDWESDYMRALAAVATSNGGAVLELGYGMGISAAAIQAAPNLTTHVIIECHPDVVASCLQDWRRALAEQRLQLLVGLWQRITPRLADGTFDGILFDTYPLSEDEIHGNHFPFFAEAHRLLKPGGVLTYYSDEAERLSDQHLDRLRAAGFTLEDVAAERCAVEPPAGCQYWQAQSLLVPRVHKANA